MLVCHQRKVQERKHKVLIVDASLEFKTGWATNELLPQHVERIYTWYHDYTDVEASRVSSRLTRLRLMTPT